MRHASTSATRARAFPLDEQLDEAGRIAAAGLAGIVPGGSPVVSSPSLRCQETAAAAGLSARVDPLLTECDFGRWAGLSLDQIEAGATRAWMTDPDAAPHGGESLRAFAGRVARWLDQAPDSATVITHAGVVRAAVVHALGAPLEAFWQIDVAPLSVTELHRHGASWTLTRLNHRVAG